MTLKLTDVSSTKEVENFILNAERQVECVQQAFNVPSYIPSDHRQIDLALKFIIATHAAPGNHFCEWGCGLGIASCLAAMNGLTATGIELNPDLINEARNFAQSCGLSVQFHCDSFIPQGSEHFLYEMDAFGWLTTEVASIEEEAGFGPDNYDIIFVYPWPGEEEAMEKLFEQHAADGALLLTYRGREGLHLHRKVSGVPRRRRPRSQSRR